MHCSVRFTLLTLTLISTRVQGGCNPSITEDESPPRQVPRCLRPSSDQNPQTRALLTVPSILFQLESSNTTLPLFTFTLTVEPAGW
jgi:hypothetical protein